jgi:hypothetical protein
MSDRPFILACDIATTSGFAEGEVGSIPLLYSEKFKTSKEDSHADVFGRCLKWMANRLDERNGQRKPDAVYIEAPLTPGAPGVKTNSDTTLRLIGMWGALAGAVKCKRGIVYREASVQQVRRVFIGHGTVDGGGQEAKRRVMAMVRLLGWPLVGNDDNAADAAALWHYAGTRHAENYTAIITPMMFEKCAARIGRNEVDPESIFKKVPA